jgi:hypothetical protein
VVEGVSKFAGLSPFLPTLQPKGCPSTLIGNPLWPLCPLGTNLYGCFKLPPCHGLKLEFSIFLSDSSNSTTINDPHSWKIILSLGIFIVPQKSDLWPTGTPPVPCASVATCPLAEGQSPMTGCLSWSCHSHSRVNWTVGSFPGLYIHSLFVPCAHGFSSLV